MPLPPLFFSFNCESEASVWPDGFRSPESKCLCPEELLCYSHNIRRELNMKKLLLIEEGHTILELTTPLPNYHLHKWKLGIVSKADWCTTHTPTSYKALFLTSSTSEVPGRNRVSLKLYAKKIMTHRNQSWSKERDSKRPYSYRSHQYFR